MIEAFGKDHKEFDDFVKGTLECMRKFRDNVSFCVIILDLAARFSIIYVCVCLCVCMCVCVCIYVYV